MNEVLPAAPHLPNAVVRLSPNGRQIFQYNWPQGPAAFRWRHTCFQRLKHRIGDFAEDVELQLLGGVIANPYRRRVFVSGQPRDDQLRQPSLSTHAVHDLDLAWTAGHCPDEPIA